MVGSACYLSDKGEERSSCCSSWVDDCSSRPGKKLLVEVGVQFLKKNVSNGRCEETEYL